MTMTMKSEVLSPRKNEAEALRLLDKFPLVLPKYAYGTAGFRYTPASVLDCIMVRVGILAAVRSSLKKGEGVGVMITASHNSEDYNGVKIADPHGGMMEPDGEEWIVRMVSDDASMKEQVRTSSLIQSAVVHVGRDTRSHSPSLAQLVISASLAMGATVVNHGVVTTPMLHHAVLHSNIRHLPLAIPPRPSGYLNLLVDSYQALLQAGNQPTSYRVQNNLIVDCACGVGYPFVQSLSESIRHLRAFNGPEDGPLNEKCGSEYVQKQLVPPVWYSSEQQVSYAAALDGDSDRIVFFSTAPFTLMDGDKIAVLLCDFLQEQLLLLQTDLPDCQLRVGVVQTAYANGASTLYLKKVLGESNVLIAKTGVKYVHAAAHTFDIGVYFEANGHGTVLFNPKFYEILHECDRTCRGNIAYQRLRVLPSLVNQAVGDALSDLLLVDAILTLKQWTMKDWNDLYQDLPSRQCKVQVEDRTVIVTNENETRCTSLDVQEHLDKAMKELDGRCFVRPSGTENVVRVYAEAPTREAADVLASRAAKIVYDQCGGVGELPVFPSSKM